jgi:hypothetical protein
MITLVILVAIAYKDVILIFRDKRGHISNIIKSFPESFEKNAYGTTLT